MRVAAHKLGSISSFPQSDTVLLTILTWPAEVHKPLGRFANQPFIYMAFYALSIYSRPHIQNGGIPFKTCLRAGKIKAVQSTVLYRTRVSWGQGMGTLQGGKMKFVLVPRGYRVGLWIGKNLSDGISREHRVLVSFSRKKGFIISSAGSEFVHNSQPRRKIGFSHHWVAALTKDGSFRGLKTCLAAIQF